MNTTHTDKAAGVSSEAVAAKTGKGWDEWFAILDAQDATKMPHKEIASYLYENHDVSGWWSQMITNGYEQARGLRGKHEMPDGYQISRSKTLPVAVETLYAAWEDEQARDQWLSEPLTLRTATPHKTMRFTWKDGETVIEARFTEKDAQKSTITVQHNKIPDQDQANELKAYWGEKIGALAGYLNV